MPAQRIAAHADWLDGLIVLLIGFTAFGIVSGLSAVILARPLQSLGYFAGAFALNVGLQVLTIAVMWRLGRVHAASAGLAGGCRNIALLLGIVAGLVPPDVQLFIVMAQLQLFFILLPTRWGLRAIGVAPAQK